MASAVFTGTVDFSTTIFDVVETDAIMRAAPSQYVRSAALPAPTPRVFVGVLTLQHHTQSLINSAPSLETSTAAGSRKSMTGSILRSIWTWISQPFAQPARPVTSGMSCVILQACWGWGHLTKMMSPSATCFCVSVEKNRLRPLASLTTSYRPGS